MMTILFNDHKQFVDEVFGRRKAQIQNEKESLKDTAKSGDPFIVYRDQANKLRKEYGYSEQIILQATENGIETKQIEKDTT